MPLPNYCAWCGRHTQLTYEIGGRPVLCSPCVDGWSAARPPARQQEIVFDGCCGEGGAARGYADAGHYVIGIDSNPDCRKGYLRSGAAEFICGDVLTYLRDEKFMRKFTFAHYSPPCQHFSKMCRCRPDLRAKYPDLITPGRPLLNRTYLPYVIENVGDARPWLTDPVTLCMWMLGRETYRHRLIEAGWGFSLQPPPVPEPGPHPGIRVNRECGWPHPVPASKAGHWGADQRAGRRTFVSVAGHELRDEVRRVMEIGWMSTRDAVAEAIPPYMAAWVAQQLAAWRG